MATLSIPNTIQDGAEIVAAEHRENYAAIAAWANGNIGTTNIENGAVTEPKLANGAVTGAKLGWAHYRGMFSVTDVNCAYSGSPVTISGATIPQFEVEEMAAVYLNGLFTISGGGGTTPTVTVTVYNGAATVASFSTTMGSTSSAGRYNIPFHAVILAADAATINISAKLSASENGTYTVRKGVLSTLVVPR